MRWTTLQWKKQLFRLSLLAAIVIALETMPFMGLCGITNSVCGEQSFTKATRRDNGNPTIIEKAPNPLRTTQQNDKYSRKTSIEGDNYYNQNSDAEHSGVNPVISETNVAIGGPSSGNSQSLGRPIYIAKSASDLRESGGDHDEIPRTGSGPFSLFFTTAIFKDNHATQSSQSEYLRGLPNLTKPPYSSTGEIDPEGIGSNHTMVRSESLSRLSSQTPEILKPEENNAPNKTLPSDMKLVRNSTNSAGTISDAGISSSHLLPTLPQPTEWVSGYTGTCRTDMTRPAPPEWQTRAPLVIVLGQQKCGTKAISSYLADHPLMAYRIIGERLGGYHGETHFFDHVGEGEPAHFYPQIQRNQKGIPQYINQKFYKEKFAQSKESLVTDARRFTFDDSPRYLLLSDRVPDAIMCVAPWVKLIALLRNPIDRAVSAFNMLRTKTNASLEWDDFLGSDLKLLREAGVVQNWTLVNFDDFSGSVGEASAWENYLQNFHKIEQELPIGRGLYAIMLEHYYAAMDRAGKPRSDLLAIRSEEMLTNIQGIYDKTLEFLNLESHKLANATPVHPTEPGKPLPDSWRKFLIDFYEPYNRRLYKLLDWDPVWKPTTEAFQ